MNLQEITAEYSEHKKELQKVKNRIEMREAQIERLKRKENRAHQKSHWTKFVNKITELVSNITLDIEWEIGAEIDNAGDGHCFFHEADGEDGSGNEYKATAVLVDGEIIEYEDIERI